MRIDGVLREKPAANDHQTWKGLRIVLTETFQAVQIFLDGRDNDNRPFEPSRTASFRGYESYLKELISSIADIQTLARAAISPQCRRIFEADPIMEGLSVDKTEIDRLPRSPEEWEQATERPVAFFNSNNHSTHTSRPHLVMDLSVIRSDCLDIARRPAVSISSAPVHCEVKLLLHLYNERRQSTNPPRPPAYSYVGVPKFSCLGCFAFISAFSELFRTRFVTKGTHSRAYWPWGFPHDCPQHEDLRKRVYEKLAEHWVPSYRGYVVEKISLPPDSTAPSGPTDGGIIDEGPLGEFREFRQKRKAERGD